MLVVVVIVLAALELLHADARVQLFYAVDLLQFMIEKHVVKVFILDKPLIAVAGTR